MLPHVRVNQVRTGAALCKCLPAACGTAGAPHMFVLWSSHTGRLGTARLDRTTEPPVSSHLSSVCLRLSVGAGLFVCPCRCLSLCCLSTPPIIIIIIIFPFLLLLLLPGSPLGCKGSQLGQGGGDRRGEERREEEEEEDGSEVPALFPCRRSRAQNRAQNINTG